MREYIKDSWALLPEKKQKALLGIFDNPSPGPWAPTTAPATTSFSNPFAPPAPDTNNGSVWDPVSQSYTMPDSGDSSNSSTVPTMADYFSGKASIFDQDTVDPATQSPDYATSKPKYGIDTTPLIDTGANVVKAGVSVAKGTLSTVNSLAEFTSWIGRNPALAVGGVVGVFAFIKYGIPAIFEGHKREPRGAQPVFMSPPPMQYIAPPVQTSYVPQPVMISGLFSRKPRSMVYVPGPVIKLQPSGRRTEFFLPSIQKP